MSEAKVIYLPGSEDAQAFTCAIAESEAEGLVWHPFIYAGTWKHPVSGEFTVDAEHLAGMVLAFNAGIPTGAGIPIDEDAVHNPRGAGAYGWIKSLEIRDGVLWGGIKWTEPGIHALTNEELKFVSAHFRLNSSSEMYAGYPNVMFSAALCTRPFFYQQPELKVAASMYEMKTTVECEGGSEMGEVIDTGTVEVPVEPEILEMEVATSVTTEPEVAEVPEVDVMAALAERDATIEELKAANEQAIAATAALAETVKVLQAQMGLSDAQRVEAEIAATIFGDAKLAPSAIEVLASAKLNPCEETIGAIIAHLQENGGKLALVQLGEVATAVAASVEPNGEVDVSGLPYGDAMKAKIREKAEELKCSVGEAEDIVLDAFNAGKVKL